MSDEIKELIKKLRVIVFREDNLLIAQCLDHNFAVQTPFNESIEKTLEELNIRFARMVAAFIIDANENGYQSPFQYLKETPKYFIEMWDNNFKSKASIIHVDLREKEAFLSSHEIEATADLLVVNSN